MMVKIVFCNMFFCLLLCGCSASYSIKDISSKTAKTITNKNSIVFVSIPKDGSYEVIPYPGSGQIVAQEVVSAFSDITKNVVIGEQYQSIDDAFATAKTHNAAYLVVPIIAHWEQRATEWSGKPSRMSVRLSIYDVESRLMIKTTIIDGRSRIVSFTSTSPQSLLKTPLKTYVNSLY